MDAPDEQQQRVAQIFQEKPAISITICPKTDESVTLYYEDYQSLLPYRWLRTQAVDVLIKLLLEQYRADLRKALEAKGELPGDGHRRYLRVLDAFVATLIMTDQEDYILESLQPLAIFDKAAKYLLIPLNTEFTSGNHWLLGVLIRQEDGRYSLVIFNSGAGGEIGVELSARLQYLYLILKKEKVKIEVGFAENILWQSNGHDCGVFTVGFSEYVMNEVVKHIEQGQPEAKLNRLCTNYKHLLSDSTYTRSRYRKLLQEQIVKCHSSS